MNEIEQIEEVDEQIEEVEEATDKAEGSSSSTSFRSCIGVRDLLYPRGPRDPLFNTGSEPQRIPRRLFEILFYILLYTAVMMGAYFITRGFTSHDSRRFNPVEWYPPMLTAIGCGSVTALAWHCFVRCSPDIAVRMAFWLSPLMTSAVGILFIMIHLASSLTFGIMAIILGIAQALYYLQIKPRLNYAAKILNVAIAVTPDHTMDVMFLALATATLHSVIMGLSITGAAAVGSGWDMLAIFGFILSLLWILHTIKNMLQTMIARIKYKTFARDACTPTWWAFSDTIKYLIGSVALGSAVVPVFTLVRVSARAIQSIFGGSDIFMFSFANCYFHVAATLPNHANRYGFVYSGVYNRGFVQASRDAWQVIDRSEINDLIETDLTGSFCFLSGMTGGAASALIAGWWMLATHQNHVTQVALYSLLNGYLMCRIGTAWAQASVSAYYIAYAEHSQNSQFDTTIRARVQELRRSQGSHRELELSNRQT